MPAPGPIQRVLSLFTSFHPGPRMIDGSDLRNLVNLLFTATANITATAGGGQAGAAQLMGGANSVDTVVNAGDSVRLPAAISGQTIRVFNNGASSLQIFGITTDAIVPAGSRTSGAVGGAVGVALASGAACDFTCYVTSTWKQHTF